MQRENSTLTVDQTLGSVSLRVGRLTLSTALATRHLSLGNPCNRRMWRDRDTGDKKTSTSLSIGELGQ